MMQRIVLFCAWLIFAQQVGHQKPEVQPKLPFYTCTTAGGCQSKQQAVTIDANWRWLHKTNDYVNCYTGNEWDKTLCPDPKTCAENCAVDGAEYSSTYGVSTNGGDLKLKFLTKGQYGNNVGSRLFLLSGSEYQTFNLLNKEFTFDVDVSKLPCGINGALYFVDMDADGGMQYPTNKAGAKYGTGYCDAQCPHDIKMINGEANLIGWDPSPSDPSSGAGKYGTCCFEMDIWEGNTISNAYTAHPCSVKGQYRCDGVECGDNPDHRYDGVCDKDGCDLNPYRMGSENFYGPGAQFIIDTTKRFTVVTQFITDDGTDSGKLQEIKRFYVQDGVKHESPSFSLNGVQMDSITSQMCATQKNAFGEKDAFDQLGGMTGTGESLNRDLVLVMSIWDDHADKMLWLDSCDPADADPSQPGVCRGTCPTTSGVPADVESQHPDAYVIYGNIKFGDIGSTDPGNSPSPDPTPTPGPGSGCCSWDGKTCSPTSDYCEEEDHCVNNCNGQWIHPSEGNMGVRCPAGGLKECVSLCNNRFSLRMKHFKSCAKKCHDAC